MLGQTLYSYDFYNRSSTTDADGDPKLTTAAADEDLQATLQHVVATYDPVNGRRIYVNGELTGDVDPAAGGTLADWDDTFAFVLGNEVSGDRQFQGVLPPRRRPQPRAHAAAGPGRTSQAGVGEKLLPAVLGQPPRRRAAGLRDVRGEPVRQLRLPVRQADVHQPRPGGPARQHPDRRHAHRHQRRRARGRAGLPHARHRRHRLAVRPAGPAAVEHRHRDRAARRAPSRTSSSSPSRCSARAPTCAPSPVPLAPAPPPDVQRAAADIGLRVFDEINATMSELTGVAPTQPAVKATYEQVQPGAADHREHRHASCRRTRWRSRSLRSSTATRWWTTRRARGAYFPGFDFGASPATAFAPAGRGVVLDALIGPHARARTSRPSPRPRACAPTSTR